MSLTDAGRVGPLLMQTRSGCMADPSCYRKDMPAFFERAPSAPNAGKINEGERIHCGKWIEVMPSI